MKYLGSTSDRGTAQELAELSTTHSAQLTQVQSLHAQQLEDHNKKIQSLVVQEQQSQMRVIQQDEKITSLQEQLAGRDEQIRLMLALRHRCRNTQRSSFRRHLLRGTIEYAFFRRRHTSTRSRFLIDKKRSMSSRKMSQTTVNSPNGPTKIMQQKSTD